MTPVDGARVSSKFGMRNHPILGYTKFHKGVDFAAPKGTRIVAAGDGKIVYAGWYSTYGQYVKVMHNKTYSTAYAHLSKLPKNMRVGDSVRQGQVIGYVGTTGNSTGPHLHFEVLKGNDQINPMALKDFGGSGLTGAELVAFNKAREPIDAMLAKFNNNKDKLVKN